MRSSVARVLGTAARVFAVFVALALLVVSTEAILPGAAGAREALSGEARRSIPSMALANAAMLSLLVLRSRWSGKRLIFTLGLAFGAVQTLQLLELAAEPEIAERLPVGLAGSLVVTGAVLAALLAPAAVALLGRLRPAATPAFEERAPLATTSLEWACKLAVGVLLHELIQRLFAHVVLGNAPSHSVLDPLQALRGLSWVLVAVPVLRMLRGRRWEASLALGSFFALGAGVPLFFVDPYLPAALQDAQPVGVSLANLVFGALLAPVLLWNVRRPTRALRIERGGRERDAASVLLCRVRPSKGGAR